MGLRTQPLFFTEGTAGRFGATNAQCCVPEEAASECVRKLFGGNGAADAKPATSKPRHPTTVAIRLLMLREPGQTSANESRKMLTPEAMGEFKFVSPPDWPGRRNCDSLASMFQKL
ncbi:MAG TPA: hypothetical protein VFT34_19170 [Verrucomicrobiae bacterium]|nr:hypothetical protein [Verrucomicrobiae bacterium]